MERKYQVFISSTYLDLKDERQAVSKAVLDLGHIPSGMELFPATNASQLDYIKKVIDDCDYYVVIVGGRYGSLDADGISFTESEYNYATDKDLPVLAFIHENIGEIKLKNTEKDQQLAERLEAFKTRLQSGRLTKFWSQFSDLQAGVITSLTSEFRDNPRTGWQRATGDIAPEFEKKLLAAKEEGNHWYRKFKSADQRLKAYGNLEECELSIKYWGDDGPASITISGESYIREVAPSLINGLTHDELQEILTTYVRHQRDASVTKVDHRSVELAALFLEVFDIAHAPEPFSALQITEKNKFLLQAAFKPLKNVVAAHFDDEIPF
ncbi:MAG: DUF4062 domain-containing protein [Proteobacteria bacterium]|nr:DUF4062 domain-containing protein [Pseudomonadota bacterium]